MSSCKKNSSPERQLFFVGLTALPVMCFIFWLHQAFIYPRLPFHGCIFDMVFHLYCPGCGGTRALFALLKGDFLLSLWYHPLVGYGCGLYLTFMVSHLLSIISKGRIKSIRFHGWYLYAALIIIVVNCLVRNYLRIRHGITL